MECQKSEEWREIRRLAHPSGYPDKREVGGSTPPWPIPGSPCISHWLPGLFFAGSELPRGGTMSTGSVAQYLNGVSNLL